MPNDAGAHTYGSEPLEEGIQAIGVSGGLEDAQMPTFGEPMGGGDGPQTWSADIEAGDTVAEAHAGVIASSRPFVDHVEQDWTAFLAASRDAAAKDASDEARLVASGFTSFMVSPRFGGALFREARAAERSAGVGPSDFGLEDVPGGEAGDASGSAVDASDSADGGRTHEDGAEEEAGESTKYGELLLQSLLCGDSPVEGEGFVSYSDSERELKAMADRVETLEGDARGEFATALIMDALPALIYLLVEAAEAKNSAITSAGTRLLRFLSNYGNPREVHVMLKLALSKVSDRYKTNVFMLITDELLCVWGVIIPKIAGKRFLFLKDVVDVLNRIMFDVDLNLLDEGVEKIVSEGTSGRRGRLSNGETALLSLLQDLAAVQRSQMDANEESAWTTSTTATSAGSTATTDETVQTDEGSKSSDVEMSNVDKLVKGKRFKSSKDFRDAVVQLRRDVDEQETRVHDLESERGVVLSLLLKLVERVASRLSMPPGHAAPSNRARSDGDLVNFLRSTLALFEDLGFDNPVDACQQCQELLGLSPYSADENFVAEVARPQLRRKRKAETFFSVRAVACYLMTALGCGKVNLSDGAALQAAGFGLCDASYAVELTIPYIITLIGDSRLSLSFFGAQLLDALLKPIAPNFVNCQTAALRNLYDTIFTQTEGSWHGLALILSKAVPTFDVDSERKFVHETLQTLLTKFSPTIRYSVIESLVFETNHHVMADQLISELKTALVSIEGAADVSKKAAILTADAYYSRFVDVMLPRFLLPRREFLAGVQPAVAVCQAAFLIAIRDSAKWNGGDNRKELRARIQQTKEALELAKDAFAATTAVVEIDVKQSSYEVLGRKADAPATQEAGRQSRRDLSKCLIAMSAIEGALDALKQVV